MHRSMSMSMSTSMSMSMSMSMMRVRRWILLAAPLAAWAAGCTVEQPPSHGECTVNAALSCNGILAGNPDAGVQLGLVGYSCTGAARPDETSHYTAGIPYGMICADQGRAADGTFGFCCTPPDDPVTCALDVTSILAITGDKNTNRTCPQPGTVRFECYGADRPEALNPAVTCGNGVRDGQLVDYCCAGAGRPPGCTEAKGACTQNATTGAIGTGGIASGLTGWVCPPDPTSGMPTLPRGEDFGMSESRADYYYFVCAVPGPPASDNSSTYCCFTPSPLLPGGSCVTATKVQTQIPDCTQGRFGFACYGRETPEDDYVQINCTEPPIEGKDDQGMDAKVYCCDYRKTNGISCASADQCQSHNCAEGFCCALASCPSCYSCGVSRVEGTCRLVPSGGADPTGMCANGCNGSGGCL